jgi:hypothetical protein
MDRCDKYKNVTELYCIKDYQIYNHDIIMGQYGDPLYSYEKGKVYTIDQEIYSSKSWCMIKKKFITVQDKCTVYLKDPDKIAAAIPVDLIDQHFLTATEYRKYKIQEFIDNDNENV